MTALSTDFKLFANSQLASGTDCKCSIVDKSVTASQCEIKGKKNDSADPFLKPNMSIVIGEASHYG